MKSVFTEDEQKETLKALLKTRQPDGVSLIQTAAKNKGWARGKLQTRIKALRKLGFMDGNRVTFEGETFCADVIYPAFPDDELPVEQHIDHLERLSERAINAEKSRRYFEIKVNTVKPICIAWMGDPHLGVGCNWKLLRRDIEIIAGTEGMYAANGGDTVDGWSDRLLNQYALSDISRKTERQLAKWFLQDAGMTWLIWLLGNHDSMQAEFATYLKTINANQIPLLDWRAQFKLVFPNGRECLVDYSHDHKGHSQWNPVHGQTRVARSPEVAHIIAGNHRHNWAQFQFEVENGMCPVMMRSRGYKWTDSDNYTVRGQWAHQNCGATVCTIITPEAESEDEFVQPISNVRRAALTLKALRDE